MGIRRLAYSLLVRRLYKVEAKAHGALTMVCRGAKSQCQTAAVAAFVLLLSGAAWADDPIGARYQTPFQIATLSQVPSQLSRECRVKSPAFEGRAPLRSVRRALREGRQLKVLAIGSSSTVGVGASSPVAGYTVRLEHDLEGFLKGADVDLIPSGMSGEFAEGTAARIRAEVTANRPDLVVWQVGTNDAMARIGEARFTECLQTTLRWLAERHVDVVLINPQYVDRLAADGHYENYVRVIGDVGRQERVLVVDRYKTMADLAKRNGNNAYLAQDRFHLNDLGYRCMAEYAARAIVSGILQAEADAAPRPSVRTDLSAAPVTASIPGRITKR